MYYIYLFINYRIYESRYEVTIVLYLAMIKTINNFFKSHNKKCFSNKFKEKRLTLILKPTLFSKRTDKTKMIFPM